MMQSFGDPYGILCLMSMRFPTNQAVSPALLSKLRPYYIYLKAWYLKATFILRDIHPP